MTQKTKVALVTGASRGIGAEIAKRLASEGFYTVVNYANSAGAADKVVEEIKAAGGQAQAYQVDVSNAKQVNRMFADVKASLGSIDVLINNAGGMKLNALSDAKDEDIDAQLNVNLKGTINTLREASVHLSSGGRVINLSSSVIGLKLERYAVYAATKAAVEVMTGILAKEMRGKQITVNAVAPGPTETELFLQDKSEEMVTKLANMSPMERLGQPSDIASVVAFLASEQGAWVNGQTIRANGGVV